MVKAVKSVFASVVFLKVQEFARRPVSEQARLRAQLEAVVAVTTVDIQAAGRIVLGASDGAAIVVLGDPQGALRLARRALAAVAAGLPLSAGLNHGAVQLARGRAGEGMAGDGIAVAASVAEFAAAPSLVASRAFRDALADAAPGAEASLTIRWSVSFVRVSTNPPNSRTNCLNRAHSVLANCSSRHEDRRCRRIVWAL